MPTNKYPSQRKLWIEAIQTIQNVDVHVKGFNVCIGHFRRTQIVDNHGKHTLVADAVPSIFNRTLQERNNIGSCEANNCGNCCQLNKQIAQLKKDIVKVNLDGNIQRQSLQHKINSLERALSKQKQSLNATQKELREKVSQNEDLQQTAKELGNNVCSTIKGNNVRRLIISTKIYLMIKFATQFYLALGS